MEHAASRTAYIFGLLAVGLLSGLLTCCTSPLREVAEDFPTWGDLGSEYAGAILGLALATWILLHKPIRSIWRAAGIALVSTCFGNPGGIFPVEDSTMVPYRIALRLERIGVDPNYGPSLAGAGFIGGAALFVAFRFLCSVPQGRSRFLVKLLGCAVGGSFLAIFGWSVASSLGVGIWWIVSLVHPAAPQYIQFSPTASQANVALLSGYARFYSLYVVWQSGVAVLLGAFLPLREDKAKATDQQSSV